MPDDPGSGGAVRPRARRRRLRRARLRLLRWLRPLDLFLARYFGLVTGEDRTFYLLIVLIGVVAGSLGVAVHKLIDLVERLLWRSPAGIAAAADLPAWQVVATLAVGAALVGSVVLIGRRSVGGKGMGMLIEAVALHGGRVPGRDTIVRAVAAIFTVGAGGSLGKEGPMVRLGAMLASRASIGLGLSSHRVKVLMGCGAAAGLAAAYNVPIGGALFAMEVILGNFALEIFGPIVVSSVISTFIARAVEGSAPIYEATSYQLTTAWEVPTYLGLGILGALASLLFQHGVAAGRGLFDRLRFLPGAVKPIVGMTLVGCVALLTPRVLGGGYDSINEAIDGQLSLKLLLLLAVTKLVATALTAGSGCSGGQFTPSLFFGAAVGGIYGYGMHGVLPTVASPVGAYALVGMAALAAGTSHAPLSSILILFEFTGNYDLILPLMLATITSTLLARRLSPYSTYTRSLAQRGIDLSWRMGEAALAGLTVGDLLRHDGTTLRPNASYREVVDAFFSHPRQRLFVVGDDGALKGAVSLHDIKHALDRPETVAAVVAHDLTRPVELVLSPDERLHRTAEVLAASDYERLPVVEPETGRFRGVLAKRDLLAVYAQEVVGRPALLATFVSERRRQGGRDYVELPPDFALRLVEVPAELVGKSLAEAHLTGFGVRVLEIKRRRPTARAADEVERFIPEAATVLARGDQLIVLGPTERVEELERGQLGGEAG